VKARCAVSKGDGGGSSSSSLHSEVRILTTEVGIWWSDPLAAGSSWPSSGPPISSTNCSGPHRWVASRFILSVLLGLAFGLPSAANRVEVKARCAAGKDDGGGVFILLPVQRGVVLDDGGGDLVVRSDGCWL
jgi:hypothetical protein